MQTDSRRLRWLAAGLSLSAVCGLFPVMAACPPIPAGTDSFPSTGSWVLEFVASPGTPELVRLSSAGLPKTVVDRDLQVDTTIETELLQLDLSGFSPTRGPVRLRLAPAPGSLGRIEGVVQDPGTCELILGESFFDVFVEIEIPDLGETWYNTDPIQIQQMVHELPFKDELLEVPYTSMIPLFDQTTGDHRANLHYFLDHADPPFPSADEEFYSADMTNGVDIFSSGYSGTMNSVGSLFLKRTDPVAGPPQTIDTEMASLLLEGTDSELGPFRVYLQWPTPTTGQVSSVFPDASYPAESFFDVYFQINSMSLGWLHNNSPHRILASPANGNPIRNIPFLPDTVHLSASPAATVLFDETDYPVGSIHDVVLKTPQRFGGPYLMTGETCQEWGWWFRIDVFDPYSPGGCHEDLDVGGPARFLWSTGSSNSADGLLGRMQGNAESLCLGSLILRPSTIYSSTGLTSSLAPNQEIFPADSFFDLFFELDTGLLGPLHTDSAVRIQTTLNELPIPQDEVFFGGGSSVALLDFAGNVVGSLEIVRGKVWGPDACSWDTVPRIAMQSDRQTILAAHGSDSGTGFSFTLVRGEYGPDFFSDWFTSFYNAHCLSWNGPDRVVDREVPPPGNAFWYLWKDGFGYFEGTFNEDHELGGQQINRDAFIPGCGS